jgi:tRNA modification GTPase
LREGLRVVIAGQPNVGKSSLLNALAGAELAIVTPIPGTTRDRVSESIQVEGVPLHITDTAGLRPDEQAADEVERIGISRSWGAIEAADVVLFLHDLTRAGCEAAYDEAEREIAARLPAGVAVIDVWNKADVGGAAPAQGARIADAATCAARRAVSLSARTGEGLDALRHALLEQAGWQAAPEGLAIARARHVQALLSAGAHVQTATAHLDTPQPALDLLAEELRLAHRALGEITGEFTSEDLLGEIFGKFCIGK